MAKPPLPARQVLSNKIMYDQAFTWSRRVAWLWWASLKRPCPKCEVECDQMCIDLRKNQQGKLKGSPHDERVDWVKMLEGLRYRGLDRGRLPEIHG